MRIGWLLFTVSCALLVAAVFTAPYLLDAGHDTLAAVNYELFSGVCHQRPERSYTIFGNKMGACARDLGIYSGLLVGSLLFPVLWGKKDLPPAWVILAAVFPLAVDGGTQLTGFRESNNTLRVVTGFLFGAAIPYYIIPPIEMLVDEVKKTYIRRRR